MKLSLLLCLFIGLSSHADFNLPKSPAEMQDYCDQARKIVSRTALHLAHKIAKQKHTTVEEVSLKHEAACDQAYYTLSFGDGMHCTPYVFSFNLDGSPGGHAFGAENCSYEPRSAGTDTGCTEYMVIKGRRFCNQ